MDQRERADKIDPALAAEPIENTEASEPTDATDSIEPAEPMDKIEPDEPIDRIDPLDPMLRMEPEDPSERDEPAGIRMTTFWQPGNQPGIPDWVLHGAASLRGWWHAIGQDDLMCLGQIGGWKVSGGLPAATGNGAYRQLASYRRCIARIEAAWPMFAAKRLQRLRQGLFGAPVEKVAENIVEDLFTTVLDWSLDDVSLQIDRADIVLSDNGYKRLVLEVKRPGSLIWHRQAAQAALDQALGYASAQNVAAVAVSDGNMLYAADAAGGGMRDRLLVALDTNVPPFELWWVSVHGIYRSCSAVISDLAWPAAKRAVPVRSTSADGLRDHKYHRPSWCFGYVGDPGNADTWKLPYLLEDGAPDTKRLPKAIQSLFSNYRGEQVKTIPREAVPDVLVRLAIAAATLRKLPCQCADPSPAYVQAHHALEQFGRLADVKCCSLPSPTNR